MRVATDSFDSVIGELEQGLISAGAAFGRYARLDRQARHGRGGPADTEPDQDAERRAEMERVREEQVQRLMGELDRLTGLAPVKEVVKELRAYLLVQQKRREAGLWNAAISMHMVFTGNPGTGKTTVARLLGRLFAAMGVLIRGHLIEVERADLVGEYIGHTAHRTREQIQKALGGVLFLDEAYSLARGGERDFGREAIDALVKGMEDYRERFIVILAGYPAEMDEFFASNPGLRSRFPMHLAFPDYSAAELTAIADMMCAEKDYRLTHSARRYLETMLATRGGRLPGNARDIRNLLERAMRRQALRLHGRPTVSDAQLVELDRCDLEFGDTSRSSSFTREPDFIVPNGFPLPIPAGQGGWNNLHPTGQPAVGASGWGTVV